MAEYPVLNVFYMVARKSRPHLNAGKNSITYKGTSCYLIMFRKKSSAKYAPTADFSPEQTKTLALVDEEVPEFEKVESPFDNSSDVKTAPGSPPVGELVGKEAAKPFFGGDVKSVDLYWFEKLSM